MDRLTRIVGVGSPYGNDQAGWLVATRLAQRPTLPAEVLTVSSPDELVPFLEGCWRLFIVDAARGLSAGVHRLEWPIDSDAFASTCSSHAMAISYLLQLAEELRALPPIVVCYAIVTGESFAERLPNRPCDKLLLELVDQAVAGIVAEVEQPAEELRCTSGR